MSLKDFKILAKLGEGAYSSVYKVIRLEDNQEYALKKVKLMNLSDKEKINALNEVRILASIRSQAIIGYKEAFLDEMSNSLCICMEYSNNGDLFQKICEYQKKGQLFSEQEIWHIFIQLVRGMKALHDLKIFHRDLKSANVFLNKDGTVKLGDMNVSKVAKKGLLYTQTGTPYYASPEVWKDQPYDSKSDIWSLGCVLYEMTTLKPPFRAEDMEGLFKKVIRGYYPRIPPHFSQDLSNVIRALLQVAPHLRPSADKILQLPAVLKRINDSHLLEVDEGQPTLLNTIRIPKNLTNLTDRMPKPNYNLLKTKKIDKHKFLQTLGNNNPEALAKIETNNSAIISSSNGNEKSSSLALPKIGYKKAGGGGGSKPHGAHPHAHAHSKIDDHQHQSLDKGHSKDDSMIQSPNRQQKQQVAHNHRSKEDLPDIGSGVRGAPGHSPQKNMYSDSKNGQQQHRQAGGAPQHMKAKKLNPLSEKSGKPIGKAQQQQQQYDNPSYIENSRDILNKYEIQRNKIPSHHHPNHNNHNNNSIDPMEKYNRYENRMPTKNQELRKILDIHQIKQQNGYENSIDRPNIHQIYKPKNRKYEIPTKNQYKQKNKYNILDIEGESKPIMHKGYKLKQQQYQQKRSQEESKLPSLGGGQRLPKIGGGGGNSQDGKMLPILQGQGGKMMGQEKDGTKIREISKAYKVNIGHLDELKERYRQIKRMDNPKRDKYKDPVYMSKNQSLPHAGPRQIGV